MRGDDEILVGREGEGDRAGRDVGADEGFCDDGIARGRAVQGDLRAAGHVKHGVAAAEREGSIGAGDEAVAVEERGAVGGDAVAESGGAGGDDDAEVFDVGGSGGVGTWEGWG